MAVFVVDKHKNPLMPTSEKRARILLEKGRAVIIKMYPFTIRLKDRVGGELQQISIKIDPGSKYTGVAVVKEQKVLNLFQINHRGKAISANLTSRRQMRRRRRSALRYRKARFNNRTKPKGWLAPSLQHRVDTVMSFANKLQKILPVAAISMELVRFDMQKMENPEISGAEYQQGELEGYEVREYILEKWNRTCIYCNAQHVPLEIEHIVPRSKGGSNRITNLTIACHSCNQKKGSQALEVFLEKTPKLLQKIQSQAKTPLKDAAAVNSTRLALSNQLKICGVPLELSSGGRTKFNRSRLSIPKTHALDAACVGKVDFLTNWNIPTLEITCCGRGSYQRTRLDKYGFPRGYLTRQKSIEGFQTGDLVKATVTKGKKIGVYKGRVATRSSGSFNITGAEGTIQGIKHSYCTLISRNDGYNYTIQPPVSEKIIRPSYKMEKTVH
jgi:5-methylcytosine-specific restriction endonuclease McrA